METITYQRQKIYDPTLRILHLWNGLAIIFLMVTIWLSNLFSPGAGENALWQLHIYIGYALVVGIVARIAWGMVGPSHARFADMWHPLAWWNAASKLNLRVDVRFGHHILASAAYLMVYLLLITIAISGLGLAAIEHSTGPLNAWLGDMVWLKVYFKKPHELTYYGLLSFILIHIAALIWHEIMDKTPIAQSMVTGYQYKIKSK